MRFLVFEMQLSKSTTVFFLFDDSRKNDNDQKQCTNVDCESHGVLSYFYAASTNPDRIQNQRRFKFKLKSSSTPRSRPKFHRFLGLLALPQHYEFSTPI